MVKHGQKGNCTMKSIKTLSTLITSLTLCACANLNVEVEVLNSDKLIIRNEMPKILALDDASITREIQNFEAIHWKYYVKQINLLRKKAQNAEKDGDDENQDKYNKFAAELNDGFVKKVGPYYDEKESEWKALVKETLRRYETYDENTDEGKEINLRIALVSNINQYEQFKKNIINYRKHDLDESIDKEILAEGEQELVNSRKELFNSGGIEHSPVLYDVVNAPEKDWAKYFDRSYGSGYFGNVDIAIKALDEPGNFTVKGLSFNPADVATMASKVTTQTVVLAAQIAGVPVNINGTPSGNGVELANASKRISTAVSSSEQLKVSLNNQKLALINLAQAILAEQDNIANNDKREEALKAIKAVYESHKDNMSIPAQVAGGKS